MNNNALTPSEQQRRAAAAIARQKVLNAYGRANPRPIQAPGYARQAESQAQPVQQAAQTQPAQQTTAYKKMPIQTAVSEEEWKKYHSAWQNYYQNYYSDYYVRAAKQYIEKERLRSERERADDALNGAPQNQNQNQTINQNQPANYATVQTANQTSSQAQSEQVIEQEQVQRTLRDRIRKKAAEQQKRTRRHRRFIPVIAGVAVVLLILFLQYNRMIFAPIMAYVAPGNSVDTTITVPEATVSVGISGESQLLIPKLNIDVPVAFGISNDSATVMEAMNHGVAHFMVPGAAAFPGQIGNTVVTGHSAGDIYSSNPYKFIFSGLERLVPGDLIYIDYEGVRYTYEVTKLNTVEPSDVQALVYETDRPMLTLITCTPLGTSRYRLLVTAQQISPSYENAEYDQTLDSPEHIDDSTEMTGNEPTFFEGLWNSITGN